MRSGWKVGARRRGRGEEGLVLKREMGCEEGRALGVILSRCRAGLGLGLFMSHEDIWEGLEALL